MGLNLYQLDNLSPHSQTIAQYTLVFFTSMTFCKLVFLSWLDKRYPLTIQTGEHPPSFGKNGVSVLQTAKIGYAGATAIDFALPLIQSREGVLCVPVAIVSGFVLFDAVLYFFSKIGS